MQARLAGKVALVVGSTKGIGRAIALKLAENGASVIVHGRDMSSAAEVLSQLESMGCRGHFESADMLDYQQMKAMVARALQKFDKIDILVASGGAGKPAPQFFHNTNPEQYIEYLSTRMLPRLYSVRAVLDHMKEKEYGKIILIVSDAGRFPTPSESLIGAANAGLIFATKVLAQEFVRWRIRINSISTTLTSDTPSYDKVMAGDAKAVFQKAVDKIPFGINRPEDLAETALFFASEGSDHITGQTLSINGGLSFPG